VDTQRVSLLSSSLSDSLSFLHYSRAPWHSVIILSLQSTQWTTSLFVKVTYPEKVDFNAFFSITLVTLHPDAGCIERCLVQWVESHLSRLDSSLSRKVTSRACHLFSTKSPLTDKVMSIIKWKTVHRMESHRACVKRSLSRKATSRSCHLFSIKAPITDQVKSLIKSTITFHLLLFFFITLKPGVECYTSLRSLNTSPPHFAEGRDTIEDLVDMGDQEGTYAHLKAPKGIG